MKIDIIACLLRGEFNYMYLFVTKYVVNSMSDQSALSSFIFLFRLQIDIYMHTKIKSIYYRNNLYFNKYLIKT